MSEPGGWGGAVPASQKPDFREGGSPLRGPVRIAESAGDTAGSLIVALPAHEMAADIKSELFQRVVKDPPPLVHNAG